VIEEDIMNVHNGASKSMNYDVIDELAYQNLEKRLKINIEKCASLHLEFWSLLSEDNPGSIRKLYNRKIIFFSRFEKVV